MRRVLRVASFLLLGLVLSALGGVGYVYIAFPRMATPPIGEVAADETLLARGTYLAEHVTLCMDCHSERDFARFSGPVDAKTHGKGGERFGRELGLPGELYAPNITPHALSSWSDGEIARAITSGVTPDGRALFPLMNYKGFAKLCRRDVEAIIAYLRNLEPIEHDVPRSTIDFPVNLIVRTLPEPAALADACPNEQTSSVELGQYLVTVAGCADCHTPRNGNDLDLDRSFAGGVEMPIPGGGKVRSKNLTPDVETGLGGWSKEAFIARFAAYRNGEGLHQIGQGDFNTMMPWSMYAGMSDRDLGAIYDYLRTQKPIKSAGPQVASN